MEEFFKNKPAEMAHFNALDEETFLEQVAQIYKESKFDNWDFLKKNKAKQAGKFQGNIFELFHAGMKNA